MDNLLTLRQRLAVLKSKVPIDNSPDGQSGSASSEEPTHSHSMTATDHMTWMQKISRQGNRADDWLSYVTFVQNNVAFSSPDNRYGFLSRVYSKAFSLIPYEEEKKKEAYANLLVKFARLKVEYNHISDAEMEFQQARSMARKFAIVHIASAEFELQRGNATKCKKILHKAREVDAQPSELIDEALKKYYSGVTKLLTDSSPRGSLTSTPQQPDQPNNSLSDTTNLYKHRNETFPTASTSIYNSETPDQVSQNDTYEHSAIQDQYKTAQPNLDDLYSPDGQIGEMSLLSDNFKENIPQSVTIRRQSKLRKSQEESYIESSNSNADAQSCSTVSSGSSTLTESKCPVSFDDCSTSTRNFGSSIYNDMDTSIERARDVTVPSSCGQTLDLGADLSMISCMSDVTRNTQSASFNEYLPIVSACRGRNLSGPADYAVCNKRDLSLCQQTIDVSAGFKVPVHPSEPRPVLQKNDQVDSSKASAKVHEELTSRLLQAHHATPDCQNESILSTSSSSLSSDRKPKRCLYRPMRVPVCPVPEEDEQVGNITHGVVPLDEESRKSITPSDPNMSIAMEVTGEKENCDHSQGSQPQYNALITKKPQQLSTTEEANHHKAHPELGGNKSQVAKQVEVTGCSVASTPSQVVTKAAAATPSVYQMQPPLMMQQQAHPLMTPMNKPGPGGLPCTPAMQQAPASGHFLPGMQLPYPCTPANSKDVLVINGKTYMILNIIGRGGTSKVYEVLDPDRKLRAVKYVDLEGADDATLNSYTNEITLLQRLQYSHHVIRMYDFEYNAGTNSLYVVMERGDTDLASLFKKRAKKEPFSDLYKQFYWKEMLTAVAVLHKEGIVHSDLKPANFLLVEGNLKLIDFGIANAIQTDKTSVTRYQTVGTCNYMSPEAYLDTCGGSYLEQGRKTPRIKIGVKSDVWSLGCILYNMVYGKTPFQHITNMMAKLEAISNPNYPIKFPEIEDKHLLDVLKRCLQRDPKDRPSIDELLKHPYLDKKPKEELTGSPTPNITKHLLKQLLQQANISSPGSLNAVSEGLMKQIKSGKEVDLKAALSKTKR